MFKPQGAGSLTKPRLEKLYAAIRKRSEKAAGQLLPLTKTEVWMVPKANVDGVRKTAARHGVVMNSSERGLEPSVPEGPLRNQD